MSRRHSSSNSTNPLAPPRVGGDAEQHAAAPEEEETEEWDPPRAHIAGFRESDVDRRRTTNNQRTRQDDGDDDEELAELMRRLARPSTRQTPAGNTYVANRPPRIVARSSPPPPHSDDDEQEPHVIDHQLLNAILDEMVQRQPNLFRPEHVPPPRPRTTHAFIRPPSPHPSSGRIQHRDTIRRRRPSGPARYNTALVSSSSRSPSPPSPPSPPPPTTLMATCALCMEEFDKLRQNAGLNCDTHEICDDCSLAYIFHRLFDGDAIVRCAGAPSCTHIVPDDVVRTLVPVEVYEAMLERRRMALPKCTKCATHSHNTMTTTRSTTTSLRLRKAGSMFVCQCEDCGSCQCFVCAGKVIVAGGIALHKCPTAAQRSLLFGAGMRGIVKPCPRCFRMIEKSGGCKHMTCNNACKYEFCWLCMGPWSSGHHCASTLDTVRRNVLSEDTMRGVKRVGLAVGFVVMLPIIAVPMAASGRFRGGVTRWMRDAVE